jgi:hypothetical protein
MSEATDSKLEEEGIKHPVQAGGDRSGNGGKRTYNSAGESDGRRPSLYKSGQGVVCTILSKPEVKPEGYFVTDLKTGKLGFLQTSEVLTPNAELLATFVCWAPNRAHMLFTLSGSRWNPNH